MKKVCEASDFKCNVPLSRVLQNIMAHVFSKQ